MADATDGAMASASSSGGAGGGSACGAEQHLCGGICTNLPSSGCYTDPTCTPCQAPENASATCAADGTCDFECGAGYNKAGSSCACASQCCSAADCVLGESCNDGVCETPPEPCDGVTCLATCAFQGKLGLCMGDTCTCQ